MALCGMHDRIRSCISTQQNAGVTDHTSQRTCHTQQCQLLITMHDDTLHDVVRWQNALVFMLTP